MKFHGILFAILLCGCDNFIGFADPVGGSQPHSDMARSCPSSLDMTAIPPPCAIAKGLPGDNLVCADFSNPQTTLSSLTSQGWNFGAEVSGNCGGWQIMNNLLQVSNFSSLNGTCGLTVPAITATELQKYSQLMLSVEHHINLSDPQQFARIALNSVSDTNNVMWQATGAKNVPRQQTIITLDKADLQASMQAGFSWFFDLTSPGTSFFKGWQIESVAVMGVP